MRLMDHPRLAERLAAAYALGGLRGGARRRFEAQAREQPALRALVATWQGRLAGLTELQADVPPPARVWKRIRAQLRAGSEPAVHWWSFGSWGLRLAGAMAGVVALVLAAMLGSQLAGRDAERGPETLALLQDDRAAPALLVSFERTAQTVTVRRLRGVAEPGDRALELWALPPGRPPRSLGVLPRQAVARLHVPPDAVAGAQALAVSLEPAGGAPAGGGPTGPVLFQGRWLPANGA